MTCENLMVGKSPSYPCGKKCVEVESSTIFNLDVTIVLYIKITFGRLRFDDYLPSKWALKKLKWLHQNEINILKEIEQM